MSSTDKQIQKFSDMSVDFAYPLYVSNGERWAVSGGLTKLEAFTMVAMQGLCANSNFIDSRSSSYDPTVISDMSERACVIAKRTLKKLESNE